jgi:Zn ribbon nucleic-acid-binding protein
MERPESTSSSDGGWRKIKSYTKTCPICLQSNEWWGPWDEDFVGFVVCGNCSFHLDRPFDEKTEEVRSAMETESRKKSAEYEKWLADVRAREAELKRKK